ncbi:MAG: DNA-binding protein [Cytophagaceae bacterium SCN 52-12]|nr:MAG: DNA-binding protein [Cytophagaceae bacterium SCN 52-12]
MKAPKVFFPGNLKFLRTRKGLSQEDAAKHLDISRVKVNALEHGRQKPTPEDLLRVSEFFRISVDTVLKVDLSRLGELKLRDLQAGNDVYMTGSNLRVLAITVDKSNKENIEYVPVKAKAGYRSGYADPEYLAELPGFTMPNLPKTGTFRMFPTTGDSMLPIPEGSDVIGQYIEDWTTIKADTPCIVILKGEQDFVFKLVTPSEGNRFLLKSWNRLYTPYYVEAGEVLELWKFYSYMSSDVPEPQTDMQEFMNSVLKELRELRGKS